MFLVVPLLAGQCFSFYSMRPADRAVYKINRQLLTALNGTAESNMKLSFFWIVQWSQKSSSYWLKREDPIWYKEFPDLYKPPTENSFVRFTDFRLPKDLAYLHETENVAPIRGHVEVESHEWIRNQSLVVLRAFLKNYEGKSSPAATRAVEDLHKLLNEVSNDRLGFGYVSTGPPEKGGIILGTFRIFSGHQNFSHTSPLLPMERSLLKDNVKPKILERLAKIRAENPNRMIFELGSHSINIPEHLDPRLADRVRSILDLFYLRYYLARMDDDAIFLSHVLNPIVARKNAIQYGLITKERVRIPGQNEIEHIQEATTTEIANRLGTAYGIEGASSLPAIQLFPPPGASDYGFGF